MNKNKVYSFIVAAMIVALWCLIGTTPVQADATGTGDTVENGCMDDLFPGSLGCTANDVRVSGVADVTGDMIVDENDITFELVCDAGAFNVGDDCSGNPNVCLASDGVTPAPELCGDRCAYPGDTTSFAATFIVELSAQERYDIGLFFGIDGDPNGDGALTGTCSISTLPEVGSFTRPDFSTGNYVDLDTTCTGKNCPQPGDLCGDINDDNNPIYYDLSSTGNYITATCVDTNGDGQLNLPNCTSWRQSGANELCTSPLQAFPGAPSKCNCDPDFQVPIEVPPAELRVDKTAVPDNINEPGPAGATVRFNVAVTNTGIDPSNDVTLNDLDDDIYGDITQVQGNITYTECSVPQTITSGGTYTCYFLATVYGDGDDDVTDTVTATGVDDYGNNTSGEDDATVHINDLLPVIDVIKTANPTNIVEPGGDILFTVQVDNDSNPGDTVTITSLYDDPHGDLNGQGTCSTPQEIAPGGSYTCSFTAAVVGNNGYSETDEVTASGTDEEGNPAEDSDTATVNITNSPSDFTLTKEVSPTTVFEPGGTVMYTFTINNNSTIDTITINSLTDDRLGDLDGQGDCSVPQVIAAGDSYTCTVTVDLDVDVADSPYTNIATACGQDDDPGAVEYCRNDDATVTVQNVPPAATLTKTVYSAVVTYNVEVCNDSTAESLELTVLSDDIYGNITQLQGLITATDCAVPQTLAISGTTGDCYSCYFTAGPVYSETVDTVTGTVSDNDGGEINPEDSANIKFNY